MNVHVILHPAAGPDETVLPVLNRELRAAGVQWSLSRTDEGTDMQELVDLALADPIDRLFVCGGDETVSAVAGAVMGARVPVGILPGDAGSVIAHELGIPDRLDEAIVVASDRDARVTPIDAIEIGDRVSILRVGVGADARLASSAARDARERLGWLVHLFSSFSESGDKQVAAFRVTVDGRTEEYEATTCVVANLGRVGGGGFRMRSAVDPSDGLMDVFVVRAEDEKAFLRHAESLLDRESEDAVEDLPFVHRTGREVRIESDPPQPVQADGEPFGDTPVELTLLKKAMWVVQPADDES